MLVGNARAGKEARNGIALARDELVRSGEVEVVDLAEPATLDEVLDRLGGRTLVVGGGDGTVHSIVQRLWDRHQLDAVTIGLLPLGTGNDFARCLQIPITPVGAAATIRFGRPVVLDLLVDDRGAVVVNAAHAGVSSGASVRAAWLKPYLGRAAYPVATTLAGALADGVAMRVDVDEQTIHEGPVLLLAVMNGTGIGGGAPVAPEADPRDGQADVIVVPDEGRLRRVAIARALRAGRLAEVEGVSLRRGRDIVVTGVPARHNVDGEVGEPVTERRYVVVPGAWRVITAPAAPTG